MFAVVIWPIIWPFKGLRFQALLTSLSHLQLVEMSEPATLLSIDGLGAMLGEGMLVSQDVQPTHFQPNDVLSLFTNARNAKKFVEKQ